jgi:hypothetical protein
LGVGLDLSSNEMDDFYGMMSGINSYLPSSRHNYSSSWGIPLPHGTDDDSSS